MHINLVSGDGNGAGKSTFARRLVGEANVFSLAKALRAEVAGRYPGYQWFSKDPEYKNTTRVAEAGGLTVRDVLVQWGEGKCAENPLYYVQKLVSHLKNLDFWITGTKSVAVDDVRKLVELEYIRSSFPDAVTHFHLHSPDAGREPQYQNDELALRADYTITWRK